MPTAAEYKKMGKDQLIELLVVKDEVLKGLKARLDKVEDQLKNQSLAQRIIDIERRGFNQQQYTRRESVEIVGLPEYLENDALEKKVVEVFEHAGVMVNKRDFHAIHRLRKSSVVIAKCVNRRNAIAILRAKKKLRETSDDDKKKLGVKGKVYINESLCPEFRRILGICNALHKKRLLSSFYTINGALKVSRDGGEKLTIGHISDLYELVGKEEVTSVVLAHKNSH